MTILNSLKVYKKEKQGFRLASFAPVFVPDMHLPKPGFGNLVLNASQFC